MRRYNLDVKPSSAACSSSIVIGIFISLPNTHWFCLLGCGLSGVVNSGCSHVAFTLQKMMLVLESLENEPTLITA